MPIEIHMELLEQSTKVTKFQLLTKEPSRLVYLFVDIQKSVILKHFSIRYYSDIFQQYLAIFAFITLKIVTL